MLHLIAVLKRENRIIGYRLYKSKTGGIQDITEKNIIKMLKINNNGIRSLKLDNNKLVGTEGALNRYTVIGANRNVIGKYPVVIIGTIQEKGKTVGYRICDYEGRILDLDIENTVTAIKLNGVANGKLVSKGNSYFISPISGEYKVVHTIKTEEKEEKTITLYHVSFDDLGETHWFEPRIPTNGAGMENKTIPRICLSDKIERCIAAIPDGVDYVGEDPIYVYKHAVSEKDIKSGDIVTYKQLYNKGYVPDALVTHEFWCTKPIEMRRMRIEVTAFEDNYMYVAGECDRRDIYEAAYECCDIPDGYMDKYNNVDCFEMINKLAYTDDELVDNVTEIANRVGLTYILTLDGFEYKELDD